MSENKFAADEFDLPPFENSWAEKNISSSPHYLVSDLSKDESELVPVDEVIVDNPRTMKFFDSRKYESPKE